MEQELNSILCFDVESESISDANRPKHYDQLNAIIQEMNYGKHRIHIKRVHSPEPAYRARTKLRSNVDIQKEAAIKYGTVNDRVEVVLFWPDDKRLPDKSKFDVNSTEVKDLHDSGFYAVVGDHTQRVMHELHDDYPRNPKWAELNPVVYVTHRTPEALNSLKSWGILDNVKGQKRVTVSFRDKVVSVHQDVLTLLRHAGERNYKDQERKLRTERAHDFDMPPNSFGSLWQIASKTGEVWDLLLKIIEGNITTLAVETKKGKKKQNSKLVSASLLNGLGGIPDEDLVQMLRPITLGHRSLKNFNSECRLYKAKQRVQREILVNPAIGGTVWKHNPNFRWQWMQHLLSAGLSTS